MVTGNPTHHHLILPSLLFNQNTNDNKITQHILTTAKI